MDGYNGDQMAKELNMEAKHSVEKQTAHFVDCFTTVSDITARECKQLLDKEPDIVTPNGFELTEYIIRVGRGRQSQVYNTHLVFVVLHFLLRDLPI